jgi:hypothetical protein
MNTTVQTLDKRHIPRGLKLGLLGLLLAAGAAALPLMARTLREHAFVTNEGPLDIRLVAVCPDGGEEFYDPDGRRLDPAPNLRGGDDYGPWQSDQQHRDFLLHVGDFNGPWLPLPFTWIRAAGTDRVLGGSSVSFGPAPDASTLLVSATFGCTYRRSWLHLLTLTSPVDQIDLNLRYYYGPRREALCTFTGPFHLGTVMPADEGRPYQLTPEPMETWQEARVRFHFVTSQPFSSDVPILFYDQQGQRHYVHSGASGHSGSNGADLTYETEAIPWDQVAVVTIGEKPHEITFHNVTVQYPHRPPRTYAAYLDVLAQRLGLTGLPPEQLRQYRFRDAEQAIEALDIVRGEGHIRNAFQALAYAQPPIKVSELDLAAQEKIHQTATRWAGSDRTSGYGILLGLLGHWPEFFDLALDRLERDLRPEHGLLRYESYERAQLNGKREMGHALARYWSGPNQSQARRLQHAILTLHDGLVLNSLFQCLWSGDPEVVLDPLWELAQDDRPWIWWRALEAWRSKMTFARKDYGALSEKIQMRQMLIDGAPGTEALQAQAAAQLAQMFTPELAQMSSQVWRTVCDRIARQFDRQTATRIYLDYLRRMQSALTEQQWALDESWKSDAQWMAPYVIRTLNVWYGVDLGHLGTEETASSREALPRNFSGFQHLLAEVLQWRQDHPEAEPLEQSLCGKVVDTAGRGITTVELRLIRYEDYTGEDGHRYQRQVEAGRCRIDASGDFGFRNLPNGSYTLHITAPGYAVRESAHVSQRPDGRFRLDGAAEDNVLVLEKPAALSGRVLGWDGQRPAGAAVLVQSYPTHGQGAPGRVRLDTQGRFTADTLTSGYHILRYVERRPGGERGNSEQVKAFRLVHVDEGQAIENVTLDPREATAALEVQVVDRAGQPVRVEYLSLSVPLPSERAQRAQVMTRTRLEPQNVHRFPNLPPLDGYLDVVSSDRRPLHAPIQLMAGQITHCWLGPEDGEFRTDVRPVQEQPANERPKEEGSGGGAPDR